MFTKECTVNNETGLHARPATAITKKVSSFTNAEIAFESKGKSINPKSLIGLLALAISKNDIIKVSVTGENEETVCNEICEFIENYRD